jgi:hypothetical protein
MSPFLKISAAQQKGEPAISDGGNFTSRENLWTLGEHVQWMC